MRCPERDAPKIVIEVARAIEEIAKEMKEREVVDELRRLVGVELAEVQQHVLLHVLDQLVVVPDFSEPLLQFLAVAVAIDDEVQLDVVAASAETEPADGEVGTAEDGVFHAAGGDVIHLSVQQV